MDDELPSTSKEAMRKLDGDPDEDDATLPPTIKDEEAEIARLEASLSEEKVAEPPEKDDERIAKIEFRCTSCDMREMVHYFGQKPPFAFGVKYLEDTYVMRDPFQPPPPRWKPIAEYYIAMGAHCNKCKAVVCKDTECSFYYTRTYCLDCAQKEIKSFPHEAQVKLRKQLKAKQENS